MTNWTPDGFIGQMFKVVGSHAPPPVKLDPPPLWGTEARVRELFGDGISSLQANERECTLRFRSTQHYLDYYRTYFGPMKMAYARVGAEGEQALTDDHGPGRALEPGGRPGRGVPSAYLEVVAVRA